MLSRITTVTDQADSYDLVTLDVIQSELGVTGNTTRLQRYLTSASKAIANFCNRVFPEEGVSDEFRFHRDDATIHRRIETLQLSRFPVTAIASVTENGATLTRDVDFLLDPEAGQLKRLAADPGHFRPWCFPVIVAYSGGYEDIPEDVADACIITVRARWLGKDRDPSVREISAPGVLTLSYGTGNASAGAIPPDAVDLLVNGNYRVPVIG